MSSAGRETSPINLPVVDIFLSGLSVRGTSR